MALKIWQLLLFCTFVATVQVRAAGISPEDLKRILTEREAYKILNLKSPLDPAAEDNFITTSKSLSIDENTDAIAKEPELAARLEIARQILYNAMNDLGLQNERRDDAFKPEAPKRKSDAREYLQYLQDQVAQNPAVFLPGDEIDAFLNPNMLLGKTNDIFRPLSREEAFRILDEILGDIPEWTGHHSPPTAGDPKMTANGKPFTPTGGSGYDMWEELPTRLPKMNTIDDLLRAGINTRLASFSLMNIKEFKNLGIQLIRSTNLSRVNDLPAALYLFLKEYSRPYKGKEKKDVMLSIVGHWVSQVGNAQGIVLGFQMAALLDFIIEAPLPNKVALIGTFSWALNKAKHLEDKRETKDLPTEKQVERALSKFETVFKIKHPLLQSLIRAAILHLPLRYKAGRLDCPATLENLNSRLH